MSPEQLKVLLLLLLFLTTALAEFPGNVDKLRHASLTEVNQFVIAKYKEFTASDIGAYGNPVHIRSCKMCSEVR